MMYGKLTNLTVNRDGSENLTITGPKGLGALYDELKDEEISFDIKKARRGRSLEANAYAWALIDQIAEKTGIAKSEVYRHAIREIGGVSTTGALLTEAVPMLRQCWESHGLGWQVETMESKLDGCTRVVLYYGSSMFNTKQMSRLIDSLIQDAEAQGIPTITDAQREKMLDRYAERKKKDAEKVQQEQVRQPQNGGDGHHLRQQTGGGQVPGAVLGAESRGDYRPGATDTV